MPVTDVAAYIIKMSNIIQVGRLHKLLYYVQKHSIELTGYPLFSEPMEAWVYGATIRDLYTRYRGKEFITLSDIIDDKVKNLCLQHSDIVLDVLKEYGDFNSATLSVLNQSEYAYIKARKGLSSFDKGTKNNIITIKLIKKGIELNK